jgi:hypothetical protein
LRHGIPHVGVLKIILVDVGDDSAVSMHNAFAIWDEWSRTCPEYDEFDQQTTWKSFLPLRPTFSMREQIRCARLIT